MMKEIKETLKLIFEKLDQINEKQATMTETQIRHEENLKEHMRRTELLENEFHPVREHIIQVRGAVKVLMGLVPIAGLIIAYLSLR